MGKDKKVKQKHGAVSLGPVTVPIRTKESLKRDNKKYDHELQELHNRYQTVANVILQLEQDYEDSKSSPPTSRYKLLKDMIKRSTTEQVIQSTQPPEFAEIKAIAKQKLHAESGGSPRFNRSVSSDEVQKHNRQGTQHVHLKGSRSTPPTGMMGLMAAAREFSGAAESNAGLSENHMSSEALKMSKKEVEKDNEHKVREISNYDNKFLRARNRLVKLKQDYESSKQHVFPQRYTLMKDMIKTVVHDKKLTS